MRGRRQRDVFSLGAALFAALEGSPPFGTGEAAAVPAPPRRRSRPALLAGTTARLFFEHAEPLTARDGAPARFGGHDAFVEPDGFGGDSCEIAVVHRGFADAQGRPAQEQLLVVVSGDVPTDRLCAAARSAADPAATGLPPA